ncbi:MAG: DUF2934 domain-containing protein [Verrucomicrobiota bacterium]
MKTQTLTKNSGPKKTSLNGKNGAKKNDTPKPDSALTEPVGDEEISPAASAGLPDEEIASRAYDIWVQQGCPDGCDEDHWHQAQRELSSANTGAVRA